MNTEILCSTVQVDFYYISYMYTYYSIMEEKFHFFFYPEIRVPELSHTQTKSILITQYNKYHSLHRIDLHA